MSTKNPDRLAPSIRKLLAILAKSPAHTPLDDILADDQAALSWVLNRRPRWARIFGNTDVLYVELLAAGMAALESDRLWDDSTKALGRTVDLPRLTVDLRRLTLTLDNVEYEVSSERALRWIKVLADRSGEWISSAELAGIDKELLEARPDKFKKYLPDAVLSQIDSKTGAGSRLRLRRN